MGDMYISELLLPKDIIRFYKKYKKPENFNFSEKKEAFFSPLEELFCFFIKKNSEQWQAGGEKLLICPAIILT